jgi:hypothetical protein
MAIGYTGRNNLAASGFSGTVLLYIAAAMLMAVLVPFAAFSPCVVRSENHLRLAAP